MRKARRFISREKQVFLVGFSLTFPRFPRISKNRLNTSLRERPFFTLHNTVVKYWRFFVWTDVDLSRFNKISKLDFLS